MACCCRFPGGSAPPPDPHPTAYLCYRSRSCCRPLPPVPPLPQPSDTLTCPAALPRACQHPRPVPADPPLCLLPPLHHVQVGVQTPAPGSAHPPLHDDPTAVSSPHGTPRVPPVPGSALWSPPGPLPLSTPTLRTRCPARPWDLQPRTRVGSAPGRGLGGSV
ncbi:uncharacterized protein [Haliaeetus albicilla]|uniref:uncharacterized protein n=1 Tax=Haliaeetus albicilla TaxID=8969 RepID=UPI0037E8EF2B